MCSSIWSRQPRCDRRGRGQNFRAPVDRLLYSAGSLPVGAGDAILALDLKVSMRCPRCDYALPSSDRFCGRCGLSRASDGFPIDPLIGLTVADRYRIEQRIGVGGMGTVYLGTQLKVGQRVAVKVLHERYSDDVTLTQRFEREAMTYARVSHPNLVALHDFGRTPDNCYYMVLEYCPGIALAKLVRSDERVDTSLIVEIIIQVARGLGAAHHAGVVHRDLKPENVMLVDAGQGRYHVKLLDFGIAKRLDDEGPRLTQVGMVFGTPEYMAPEQARGETVDLRSDVYALGCMLYELLTGDAPFTGSNKLQIMHRQASEKPIPPSEKVSGVHPKLEAIALKCLSKRPNDRYPDTLTFIDAVEGVFGHSRPTPIPPRMRLRRTAGVTTADTQMTFAESERASEGNLATEAVEFNDTPLPTRTTTHRPVSRRPMWIMAAAATLFVMVLVSVFVDDDDDPDPRAVVVPPDIINASATEPEAPPPDAPVTDAPVADAPVADAPVADAPQAPEAVAAKSVPTTAAPTSVVSAAAPTEPAGPTAAERQAAEKAARDAEREAKVKRDADRRAERKKAAAEKRRKGIQARLESRINDAKKAYNRGQLQQARREAKAVLSADRKHPEAKALVAQIADVERRIRIASAAFKAHDCPKVLKTLRPVIESSPAAKALNMVNHCKAGLPPKTITRLD